MTNFFFNNQLGRVRLRSDTPSYSHTVIIGGGIAGVTTLYQMLSSGVDTVLLECDDIGFRSSGRSVGFIGLPRIVEIENIDRIYSFLRHNNILINNICDKENIFCDLSYNGDLHLFNRRIEKIISSVESFNKRELHNLILIDKFKSGLFFPAGMSAHCYGLMIGLIAVCESINPCVYGNFLVNSIRKSNGLYKISCKSGQKIECKNIIVCTPSLLGKFKDGKSVSDLLKSYILYGACSKVLPDDIVCLLPSYNLFLEDLNIRLRVYQHRLFIEHVKKYSNKQLTDLIQLIFNIKIEIENNWFDTIYEDKKSLFNFEMIDENVYANTGYGRYGFSNAFTVAEMLVGSVLASK